MIIESDRKIRETNFGSFLVTIDKKWAKSNELKAGDKLKQISTKTITILIAPNSPLLKPANKQKLDKILTTF